MFFSSFSVYYIQEEQPQLLFPDIPVPPFAAGGLYGQLIEFCTVRPPSL
jgi:hypothetical protein